MYVKFDNVLSLDKLLSLDNFILYNVLPLNYFNLLSRCHFPSNITFTFYFHFSFTPPQKMIPVEARSYSCILGRSNEWWRPQMRRLHSSRSRSASNPHPHLNKYILKSKQIHCNLDMYFLQFGHVHFVSRSRS